MDNTELLEENIKAEALLLNVLLADEYILNVKTKNYHWNVTGMHFLSLHEFFEKLYKKGDRYIDEVAERIRTIGEKPIGTMREFLEQGNLEEDEESLETAVTMLENLANDHESIIRNLRAWVRRSTEELKDDGTGDFLTDLLRKHEKAAWMLRSHLNNYSL